MIQFPVKASFLGKRKAQSHFGNPGTWTAESHFLGPRVHSDLVNLLERLASFSFLVFFSFFFLPLPSPLARSLSLGHFPKKESNTDINTGLVQLLFPQCTKYINIPGSFIGRAGWSQAPTDPNSGCLCRICSLCSAPGPSTVTTEDSAGGGEGKALTSAWVQTDYKLFRLHNSSMQVLTMTLALKVTLAHFGQQQPASQSGGKWAMHRSAIVSRHE